jgi:hypothetical protein
VVDRTTLFLELEDFFQSQFNFVDKKLNGVLTIKLKMMSIETKKLLPDYEPPRAELMPLFGGNILVHVSLDGDVEDFLDGEDF